MSIKQITQASILLVDDSHIIRKSYIKALKKYVVENFIEAENGLEALNILSHEKISVIIADINMPKMDGIEFLKLLREKKEAQDIPVIIISASNSKNDIIQAVKLQASFVLKKPVDPDILFNTIQQALNNRDQILNPNWTIVIADKLPAARKTVTKLLNDLGLKNILEASNLSELEESLKNEPDLVIADWNIDHSGLETLLHNRKLQKNNSIPFVVIASDARRETVMAAAVAGASNFLAKPFDKNLVKQSIIASIRNN